MASRTTRVSRTQPQRAPSNVDVVGDAPGVGEEDSHGEEMQECFFPNHKGVPPKVAAQLVPIEIPDAGGEVLVCKAHAFVLEKMSKMKAEQPAGVGYGECHVCFQQVGTHHTDAVGDITTWWEHMDDQEIKCHETCDCPDMRSESPPGRTRASRWLRGPA